MGTALVSNNVRLAEWNALISKSRTRSTTKQNPVVLGYATNWGHKTTNPSSVNEGSQPEHINPEAASIIHAR